MFVESKFNIITEKSMTIRNPKCQLVNYKYLTCACVNNTLRLRLCARGNCMGFASGPAQAASPPMLLTWPIPLEVEVMSLETKTTAQVRSIGS